MVAPVLFTITKNLYKTCEMFTLAKFKFAHFTSHRKDNTRGKLLIYSASVVFNRTINTTYNNKQFAYCFNKFLEQTM